MDDLKIYTEEPEQELWQTLLQFSYRSNILRYFEENSIVRTGDEELLVNCVAGAILQADEYYKASKTVSLQVEPLLLYYGTTNLLYAMTVLKSGTIPQIKNHGMHLEVNSENNFIADTGIIFDHYSDGGIHVYSKSMGYMENLCQYHSWTLGEFLDSIAEIKDDFERCYRDKASHILQLNIVNTSNGVVERINLESESILSKLNDIEGFSKSYLKPQISSSINNERYIVLHRKMNGKDIRQIAYSGQPYLQVGHTKNGRLLTVPSVINMYVSLFVLGSMCRYHPEKWNPFVTQDSTGEKLLLEKFLYFSRRILPNIVLNNILEKRVLLSSDKYMPEERVNLVGQHEVKEIVAKELKAQIKKEHANSILKINRG